MWAAANATVVTYPRLTERGGPGRLVVQYGSGADCRDVVIPMAADGRPVCTFAYPTGGWSAVTPAQRAAVHDRAAAIDPVAGARDDNGGTRLVDPSGGLVALAYVVDGAGRPVPAWTGHGPTCLVVVPADRPRIAAARLRSQVGAALLTPLTAAADTVVIGVLYPLAVVLATTGLLVT